MSYTIWCILSGEDSEFPVELDESKESKTVGHLKEAIKAKCPVKLASVDPFNLTLYRIDLKVTDEAGAPPFRDTVEMKMKELKEKGESPLHPAFNVRKYYPTELEGEMVQIFAQVPENTQIGSAHTGTNAVGVPKTPPTSSPPDGPLHHTPPKLREVDGQINAFLNKLRPRMQDLVVKAQDVASLLPSWRPSADHGLAEHISALRIPTLSTGEPSLLLHRLGEDLDGDRIARIFSLAAHVVLINTSGSGKTRILLEGLCSRWGFYFVAKPDMTGIGSGDFELVMRQLDSATDYTRAKEGLNRDPEATQAGYRHIREVVERRLTQLLLARFLLLDLLVQVAGPELDQKRHRLLWVLLQVQPKIFGPGSEKDIFTDLTLLLRRVSTSDLNDRIDQHRQKLSVLLEKVHHPKISQDVIPPFFCVLDEVQVTVTAPFGRLNEFMSDINNTPRPILREIWRSWSRIQSMHLVFSGTGVELQAFEDGLVSVTLKAPPYHTSYNTGAFDDPQIQAAYISRYLPMHFDESQREEIFTRAWAWLRGRYRSTATLILLILDVGYQCPHRTIDEYVKAFTGFRPTDGKDLTDNEPELPPDSDLENRVSKLNFEKMDPRQADTLRNAVYDQIYHGSYDLTQFGKKGKNLFIEYGVARHRGNKTVIDEPLAILAALEWANLHTEFSVFKWACRSIHEHSSRKNGFELYLTYYLQKVFDGHPELNAVFTFRRDFAWRENGDLAWQREQFELVTVTATAKGRQISPVTSLSGPSSNFGSIAESGAEVLEWISTNPNKFTFCFPPPSLGPDILFFVRSTYSKLLLLVVIQAKKYEVVTKATLLHGVRTVTPSWFWKSKDLKHATAETAPLIHQCDNDHISKLDEVLKNIPLPLTADGADYPVLRVFASWPGRADLGQTQEWKEEQGEGKRKGGKRELSEDNTNDPDRHPLATLDLAVFNEVSEKLNRDWFRGVEQEVVVSPKRAREEQNSRSLRCRKQVTSLVDQ